MRALESGEERELVPHLRQLGRPRWAPNGRRILIHADAAHGAAGIYGVDVDTGATERLLAGDVADFELGPDGKRLWFSRRGELLWYDIEKGSERKLDGAGIFDFALSPSGRALAFQKEGRIYVMPSEGGAPRLVFQEQDDVHIQTFGGEGSLLVVRKRAEEEASVWRIPLDGGAAQPTGLAMDELRDLRLHPDGRRVTFTAGAPRLELWVMESFLSPS